LSSVCVKLFEICKNAGTYDSGIPPGPRMSLPIDELRGKVVENSLCDEEPHAEPFVFMDPSILEEWISIEVFREGFLEDIVRQLPWIESASPVFHLDLES